MIGIRIDPSIGIGDAIQFTSVPENYFMHFGSKLHDVNSHWVLDHNPYVTRGVPPEKITREVDLWKAHCGEQPVRQYERTVLMSNAESHARHFDYTVSLNRPRLYRFEEYPFFERKRILLHVKGRSHGQMPEPIVEHVMEKYGHAVSLIGHDCDWKYSLPMPHKINTFDMWSLVEAISKCRMFIGVDSGPSWIAQCFPDILVKKVRLIPDINGLKTWVPLESCRVSSHWDDRSAFIYNPSTQDVGFTWAYTRI